MNHRFSKKLALVLMGAFVALLAAAVFLWGVQYKVSLYPIQRRTPTVPVAKLLSEKERPAAHPAAKRLALKPSHIARCSFVLLLAARFPVGRPAFRLAPLPLRLRHSSRLLPALYRFSFRPPPFSIA